jgi:TonB family protein
MRTLLNVAMVLFFSTQSMAKTDGVSKPQFPGGDQALVKYLDNNMKYPEEAQKQKWQGNTLIAFTVNEDGSITNVRVLKSSQIVLDNEALRIIKTMPKWAPAYKDGIAKKEMVVLPVTFDLNKKNIQY